MAQGKEATRRGERHELARLPGDARCGSQPAQELEEIRVFAVHHVRTDVDRIAARVMLPAARAAAQLPGRLEHGHASALPGEGHRATQARQPAADDQDFAHRSHAHPRVNLPDTRRSRRWLSEFAWRPPVASPGMSSAVCRSCTKLPLTAANRSLECAPLCNLTT